MGLLILGDRTEGVSSSLKAEASGRDHGVILRTCLCMGYLKECGKHRLLGKNTGRILSKNHGGVKSKICLGSLTPDNGLLYTPWH